MASEFDDLASSDDIRREQRLSENLKKLQQATDACDFALGIEYRTPSVPVLRPTGRRLGSGRDTCVPMTAEEISLTIPGMDPLEKIMNESDALAGDQARSSAKPISAKPCGARRNSGKLKLKLSPQ